ncbi:MAG: LacI family DNA-binding transcriptional regulator [Ornithinibacter sp.]
MESLSPTPARVTIHDVARAASVSRQTVSNALKHPERLSPQTLDRVLAAIDDLGYEPSSSAQSLRSQRSGAIGVEVNTLGPRAHNETMAPFLCSLGVRATEHDCHVVPFGSTLAEPMLRGYEEMWRRRLVDAFIIADTHHGDPRPEWLEARGIPFAAFGRVWDDPTFTRWVDVDGAAGTRAAVRHCLDRGYTTIGYLGWPKGSVVGDDRRSGWRVACEAASPDVAGPEASCEQDLDEAIAAATALIHTLPHGSAVVCASDVLALGVHQALLASGRGVGTDVGVVGFDGSETARMHHITTLAQPLADIADLALTLVHDALAGAGRPSTGTILAPRLLIGRSTGPLARP